MRTDEPQRSCKRKERIAKMQKIVINACYGGFSLSHEACMKYLELAGKQVWPDFSGRFFKFIGPTYWLVPPEEQIGDEWNEKYSEQMFNPRELKRDDPILVQVVEELKGKADGRCASLKIVDVPDGVNWAIEEYDGMEWVAEKHRTWGTHG